MDLHSFFQKLELTVAFILGKGFGGFSIPFETEIASRVLINNNYDQNEIILFDCGANEGKWTISLINRLIDLGLFSKTRFFLFEPAEKHFNLLRKTFEIYDNVEVYKFGVSDSEKKLILYADFSGSELSSIYHRQLSDLKYKTTHQENIIVRPLNVFMKERGISKLNFLKLDIEGHEMNALMGLKDEFRKNAIDALQFEFGRAHMESKIFFRDFFIFFTENKYDIYRITPLGLHRIRNYKEIDEHFIGGNYVSIRSDLNFIDDFSRPFYGLLKLVFHKIKLHRISFD